MTKIDMTIEISAILKNGISVEDFIENLDVISVKGAKIDITNSDVLSLENN